MDGNFSWKRRKDRNSSKNNWEQGIFAPSRAESALVAPPEEVERFNDHTEVTDEEVPERLIYEALFNNNYVKSVLTLRS